MSTKATICPTCSGKGRKSEKGFMKCGHCNGTGQENVSNPFGDGLYLPLRKCRYCGGSGEKQTFNQVACNPCSGKGYL